MEENAFAISDIDSSREISQHIEYQFAKYNTSQTRDDSSLAILVGGGSFTGIELLGELVEKVPQLCKKYYIDRSKVRIINVEESPLLITGIESAFVDYA